MRRPNSTVRSKVDRRDSAERFAEERTKRSDEEQIALLDKRLGLGIGAKRERTRLFKKAKS
jgi:hypothetical protein